jgi:DNA topoisomerase-1
MYEAAMLSAAERADSAGLHYVAPDALPLRRVRKGRGFCYLDQRSKAVNDDKLRTRLQKLAVPPAWEDVRLARDPKSHIQAVGRDHMGRLQYRYHDLWTETGNDVKRERLEQLGNALGELRAWIEAQLRRHTIDEDFALACALALLDRAGLRIGYPEYSREDGGRGATTLTRKDVYVREGVARLRFFGKGGKRIQRFLDDAPLARALALLKSQPGEMLFRWRGKDGEECCLTADAVNAALRQRCGEATSAKDFRTFRASSIVAGALQDLPRDDEAARSAALKQSINASASFLANTPTVARSSYVHPLVQEAFTDATFDPVPLFTGPQRAGLTRDETALLRLLKRKAEK